MRIDLGNDCDFEATADRGVAVPAIDIRTGPFSRIALGRQALWSLSVTMITAASLAASIAALGLGLWIADRQDFDMGLTAPPRSQLIVPFALLPLLQALVGLIPGYGIGPVQRLRRHIHATLLLGAAVAVCFLSSQPEPRLLSAGMAGLAIQAFLTPFVDHLCRRMLSGTRCWGASALVVGAGPAGERVVRLLRADPRFGYRPLGLLDDDASLHGTEVAGVPVLGPTGLMWDADLARQVGLLIVTIPLKAVAIQPVPMQVTPIKGVESADQACRLQYERTVFLPPSFTERCGATDCFDVEALAAFEIRNRLVNPGIRVCKRIFDLTVATTIAVAILPFAVLVALAVVLDSPGPALFRQPRLGRNGRIFHVLKFRTMIVDAEDRLRAVLASSPAAREEYGRYHKLRNDPRITRLGRILRATSIDEIPQLWNVIVGDMSLVGPRPYLPREQAAMAPADRTILLATPGITGLWQVTGRNRKSFEDRIRIDIEYVRNWSLWVDLYVLAKTIPALLDRKSTS